jgi:primary-amine oxidase
MDTIAAATIRHPLDPLSLAEISTFRALVTGDARFDPALRFTLVELREPDKAAVLAFRPGDGVVRGVRGVLLHTGSGAIFEVLADLTAGRIAAWGRVETAGQPPIILDEFMKLDRIVKSDPRWVAAVKRRGITDADLPLVQVDPFSAGNFGFPEEQGRRLVRAVSYWRGGPKDNGYAHPIEGVVAVVDLIEGRILTLVDDPVAIPVPRTKRNYDPASLPPERTDLRPLSIVQPQGPSFTVDGWEVAWQNWRFRVGFTPKEGLVLHRLSLVDQGVARPIIHRASVAEMVVPYADPTTNHFWKNAFDAGEYGLGKLANSLELGCDCLGTIHYFDVPAADDHGEAFVMPNAICMHEEDYGTLWKHYEFRNDVREVRRSRRLVISFFATVGNYDYGFYWYLYQDGTIQLEAKLTGIIQTAAVMPGEKYPWGGMIGEGLGGPTHQHFFCARLHMSVDGEGNTVTEHEFVPRPWGTDNPYGNVFDTTSRVLARERDAAREADGRTGRYWKISNPNKRNVVGNAPGYKLAVQASPLLLAQEGSAIRGRAGFATKHVWVTAYDPAERFPAGEFPNQHPGGEGLPAWIEANRPIENADVVVWHNFGHTHVCKPEDMPIMPVEYAGFMLKPNGFLAANPAMDLPRDSEGGQGGSCCSSAPSSCCDA